MAAEGTIKREITLSAAWANGTAAVPVETVEGQPLSVVFRGAWTHGFGPDFRDAMVCFDGVRFQTGSIEIHLDTRGWRDHGHHLDPRYNDVVLHLVARHDGGETRRQDGAIVPVAILSGVDPVEEGAALDWGLIGGEVCADSWAAAEPKTVTTIVKQLGDIRIAAKTARIEAALTAATPADVLFREMLDGFGYSMNREPMRRVADLLPLAEIESRLSLSQDGDRLATARGLLFGAAGFLPLAPSDAALAHLQPNEIQRLEAAWDRIGGPWCGLEIKPTEWNRARVRPSNHPAARLNAVAALLAHSPGGLLAAILNGVRQGLDVPADLRRRTFAGASPGIGLDRATAIVTNAIVPFTLALAEQTGDLDLHDAGAALWDSLGAADSNEVTKRAQRQVAGKDRLPGLGARGQQGLIHLDQTLCGPRRCFECPIGVGALAWRSGPPLEVVDRDAAIDDEILSRHPG